MALSKPIADLDTVCDFLQFYHDSKRNTGDWQFFRREGSNLLLVTARVHRLYTGQVKEQAVSLMHSYAERYGLDSRIQLSCYWNDIPLMSKPVNITASLCESKECTNLSAFFDNWVFYTLQGGAVNQPSYAANFEALFCGEAELRAKRIEAIKATDDFLPVRLEQDLYFITHAPFCASWYGQWSLQGKYPALAAEVVRVFVLIRTAREAHSRDACIELATAVMLLHAPSSNEFKLAQEYIYGLDNARAKKGDAFLMRPKGVDYRDYHLHSIVVLAMAHMVAYRMTALYTASK
jgi:hypothetical protein